MDCLDAIMTRKSIRSFKPDAVPKSDLVTILNAGRKAPTAGNLQPCHFVVVQDEATRKKLQKAAFDQELIAQAPVIIVVAVEPERSSQYGDWGRNYLCHLDGANATENMLLAAHALGYGACWVGGLEGSKVIQALGLPQDFKVISMIPIGKPDEDPEPRPRRTLEDMVRWERW